MALNNEISQFDDSQKFPSKGFTALNDLKNVDRLLTNAELLAINSTPIILTSTPDANSYAKVIAEVWISYKGNGVSYTADDCNLRYTGTGNSILTIPKADFEHTSDFIKGYVISDLSVSSFNDTLELKGITNFTGAGPSIKIDFIYRIISAV